MVGNNNPSSSSLSSQAFQIEVNHRRNVARIINSIWTRDGTDISGLAEPLLSSRLDTLGQYVMMLFDTDDDDNDGNDDTPTNTNTKEDNTTTTIDRVSCEDLSYESFVKHYMQPNHPVIITGLTRDWKASTEWIDNATTNRNNNTEPPTIDVQTLRNDFGETEVDIHIQRKRGFTLQKQAAKRSMTVADYVDWWEYHHLLHEIENDDNNNEEEELHYLKDWKMSTLFPHPDFYRCPHYFTDDWLNTYMKSAYQFVYLGPKGTSTKMHTDVLQSYSWSSNVIGVKRWYLIPPEYGYLLRNWSGTELAPHIHADNVVVEQQEEDANHLSVLYPGLQKARKHAIRVIQYSGETIFVPSGWHHTVENLEDTLSINHNWMNGYNIKWSWERLKTEMDAYYASSSVTMATKSEDGKEGGVMESLGGDMEHTKSTDDDTSQIGDDLYLLYILVTKKAAEILNHLDSSTASAATTTTTTKQNNDAFSSSSDNNNDMYENTTHHEVLLFNITKTLPILQGILQAVTNKQDFGLMERSHGNVSDLMDFVQRLKNYL